MKLDSRIIDGKKPLTCFDTEEARKFEGEEGYFSDYPKAFADGEASIDECAEKGILTLEGYHENCPYVNKTTRLNYPYFLPAEWLKPEEPEKKWRPFTLDDFVKRFDLEVGTRVFLIRSKTTPVNQRRLLLTGIIQDKDPCVCGVYLGGCYFTFSELFQKFDVRFGKEDWQPFGVEDVSE